MLKMEKNVTRGYCHWSETAFMQILVPSVLFCATHLFIGSVSDAPLQKEREVSTLEGG